MTGRGNACRGLAARFSGRRFGAGPAGQVMAAVKPGSEGGRRPRTMSLFESLRLAFAQIRAQKLKSFFTLLGLCAGLTSSRPCLNASTCPGRT